MRSGPDVCYSWVLFDFIFEVTITPPGIKQTSKRDEKCVCPSARHIHCNGVNHHPALAGTSKRDPPSLLTPPSPPSISLHITPCWSPLIYLHATLPLMVLQADLRLCREGHKSFIVPSRHHRLVGPRLMRCQHLLKQECIDASVHGSGAGGL